MKLKPCPFCGKKAVLHNLSINGHPCYLAKCKQWDCRAEIYNKDREELFRVWNKRNER